MKSDLSKSSPLSAATLHILLALADEDLHGYGIIQKAARQSDQHYRLGPGTLYDNLKKLMDQGLVVDSPNSSIRSDDDKRLYRLTSEGRVVLSAELDRLKNVLRQAELTVRAERPKSV
jgi:DNA-binding PadR family transcriptional regulator